MPPADLCVCLHEAVFFFFFTFILERRDGKGTEQHPVSTSGGAGLFREGGSFNMKYVQPPGGGGARAGPKP